MHIPDGFLAPSTWIPAWFITIGGLGVSLRRTQEILKERMVPLMGVMSAFIFAAQMLNFPVIGGTSGHLLGGVLAAILLGPYAGAVVIAVVLIAQCFIFQDGGITALGANILNMSFVGAVGGYFIYRIMRRLIKNKSGLMIATAVAAWSSVVLASAACALELFFSGVAPLRVVFPAMVGMHALIGIGEAVITCLAIGYIRKVRPDLIASKI
ncbi:MAG: energy-coupling factor ABC transporter permease [Candidatus Omnitrophota bacterium]